SANQKVTWTGTDRSARSQYSATAATSRPSRARRSFQASALFDQPRCVRSHWLQALSSSHMNGLDQRESVRRGVRPAWVGVRKGSADAFDPYRTWDSKGRRGREQPLKLASRERQRPEELPPVADAPARLNAVAHSTCCSQPRWTWPPRTM